MLKLSDEDILLRLEFFEDSFVERKTASDSKDWLKTVVAFANSTPVGDPAILFSGVRNDGSIEDETNLDSLTGGSSFAAHRPLIHTEPITSTT